MNAPSATTRAAVRESAPRQLARADLNVVVALFALSGAAALVDQVCFSKYLSYIMGATAYAVSAVLAAFMGGMVLGAALGGRLSTRTRRPLTAYALAEIAVAIAVGLAPWAFEALTPTYVRLAQTSGDSLAVLTALRWVFAASIVLLPTTAMGMTLPLLAPALGKPGDARRGRRLTALYSANTLGGAVGALVAAYAILPWLGLANTLRASALVSAAAALAALVVSRRVRTPTLAAAESGPQPAARNPGPTETPSEANFNASQAATHLGHERWLTLYCLALLSGLLVFVSEVVGTHLLATIIGNSAYAFALILAVFLLALFAGASASTPFAQRFGETALPLSLSLTGLAWVVTLPLWDKLPYAFSGLGDHVTSFWGREAMRALVAVAILALPTTLMGLTFPLLLHAISGSRDVGRWVGRLTALNTVGSVMGALAAAYLLLPELGSQGTLLAVALAFVGAALLVTWSLRRRSTTTGLICGVTALGALLTPGWDLARLTAGTNIYFDGYVAPDEVMFVREDVHGGVTTVTRNADGVKTLYTNGKFQGNDGWEMHAQRYFAHYPSLFVEHFERALVIGLGTGTTLGTYTAYPWRQIDLVEISPSIVEAAQTYFTSINRHALDDPRVTLHLGDGRNFLLTGDQQYDLIGLELSSVWFAGASALYSSEYYANVARHLKPGGVFQQWVQLHHIHDPVFATILNTLRQRFAHVALFFGGGQGILVASQTPLQIDRERLRSLNDDPEFKSVLPAERPLLSLLDDLLVVNEGLDRFIEDTARRAQRDPKALVATDDNLRLEYDTPKGNVLPWNAREDLVQRLLQYRNPGAASALVIGETTAEL